MPYEVFEPYYAEAERLFHVHGQRGEDPNEPPSSGPFPYPPVSHEPAIQGLDDGRRQGLHPFHLPLGILLDEKDGKATPTSTCIRCDTFDGFPCPLNGKADAQVMCVDPPSGRIRTSRCSPGLRVESSRPTRPGKRSRRRGDARRRTERYSADIVVVACGALSSALLLLRSANAAHPAGLANGSDQVGRNYMRHNQSVLMALMREPNDTVFQKTLAVSDFYFGADDWEYPLGLIQMCATSHGAQVRGESARPGSSGCPKRRSSRSRGTRWISGCRARICRAARIGSTMTASALSSNLKENNMEAHHRLKKKLEQMLSAVGAHPCCSSAACTSARKFHRRHRASGRHRALRDRPRHLGARRDCKAHELDNLYLADASFFPSIGAVNPTLTIIANALRVADIVAGRLGARAHRASPSAPGRWARRLLAGGG